MIKKLLSNWQTSSTGLTLIIGSVVHLIFTWRTATEGVWTASLTAIVGGLGLMFAGDANKSAPVKELEQVKSQMGTVAKAVTTGDTSILEKSIVDATTENK
jgi:hypothetical protein